MLPAEHRLRSTSLFRSTVRRGRKKGSRTVVVYLWAPDPGVEANSGAHPAATKSATPLVTHGGPRAGIIVSKAVGNAVKRHAVSRLLRAVLDGVIKDATPHHVNNVSRETLGPALDIPSHSFVVVRALPAAAKATSQQLDRDIRSCLRRLGV